MKLILGLCTFCALVALCVTGQDFYYDEKGKTYVIDPYGNRRYSGSESRYPNPPKPEKPKVEILDFAINLFRSVENDGARENYVVAPLSPQILLSFLAKETDGNTRTEIVNATNYEDSSKLEDLLNKMQKDGAKRELKIGNAIFVSKQKKNRLRDTFAEIIKDKQQSPQGQNKQLRRNRPIDGFRVDFSDMTNTKMTYNQWVSNQTNGALKSVQSDFDENTELLLASTVYFRGQWLFTFNTTQTSDFYLIPNDEKSKIGVETMRIRKKFHSGTFDNIKARWAAIPYNSTESMIVIMPKDGETLDNVIGKMTGNDINDIVNVVIGSPTMNFVNITLPKFKLKTTVQLTKPLQKMGINDLFTSQSTLKVYKNGPSMKIGSALQQSFLEVDEEGSVGASTTTFSAIALTVQPETKHTDFVVDQPFAVFIVDRRYAVPYFMAKIYDPRY
ncbi:leukocyte elastase inhibitor-like [Chironomus tepperi]|uniref:leukocyte elastase inhibitor-like n=1 Tax=Chironomus tepperi TaxID=113505 RepID=UPI00391FBE73